MCHALDTNMTTWPFNITQGNLLIRLLNFEWHTPRFVNWYLEKTKLPIHKFAMACKLKEHSLTPKRETRVGVLRWDEENFTRENQGEINLHKSKKSTINVINVSWNQNGA